MQSLSSISNLLIETTNTLQKAIQLFKYKTEFLHKGSRPTPVTVEIGGPCAAISFHLADDTERDILNQAISSIFQARIAGLNKRLDTACADHLGIASLELSNIVPAREGYYWFYNPDTMDEPVPYLVLDSIEHIPCHSLKLARDLARRTLGAAPFAQIDPTTWRSCSMMDGLWAGPIIMPLSTTTTKTEKS